MVTGLVGGRQRKSTGFNSPGKPLMREGKESPPFSCPELFSSLLLDISEEQLLMRALNAPDRP